MPAALYDYCRKGKHSPIKVGDGFLLPTDQQTQAHLLCKDCEDTLSKGGEAWIADKLATRERAFPLYEILTKMPPDFDEDGMAVYFAAKNPEIKVGKLIHFALGLFWKASVYSWSGRKKIPRIELGPYSESIRKWLLGQSQFPQNVYLIAAVSRPQRAQITLSDPYEGVRREWHTHFVHVPGLLFTLTVGKTVDESIRVFCIHNSPGNPVTISDSLTDSLEQVMVKAFRRSRKTQVYLRAMANHDRERR
jgi:hypothetical protein